MKIADNRLLLGTFLAFAAYWICGFVLPWDTFAPVVNLLLVVAAGLTFLRYLPEASQVLFQGRRNERMPEGDGSHLAIYGTALIGLGGILAAVSAFALISPTLRAYIQGTPAELVGRAIASAGLGLVFLSPNVTRRGITFGGGFWLYAGAALTMVAIYALGYSAGFRVDHEPVVIEDSQIPADRPRCPLDRPVWGTDSAAYHVPGSTYRRQVTRIERCFTSVQEAREAGFRAPE